MTQAPSSKYARVGLRIRLARNGVGLSQEAFAERISTSRRHVMRLERGDHMPSQPMLSRIAEVTGVTAAEIANGDDEDEESHPVFSIDDFAGAIYELMVSRRRATA